MVSSLHRLVILTSADFWVIDYCLAHLLRGIVLRYIAHPEVHTVARPAKSPIPVQEADEQAMISYKFVFCPSSCVFSDDMIATATSSRTERRSNTISSSFGSLVSLLETFREIDSESALIHRLRTWTIVRFNGTIPTSSYRIRARPLRKESRNGQQERQGKSQLAGSSSSLCL